MRLGHTQREIIEFLSGADGAASSWAVAKELHSARAMPALWRLHDRGLVKRSGCGHCVFTPAEIEALRAAEARQPRAYAFWVLAAPWPS